MSFRNYVYISKGKIEIYYPQIRRDSGELTASLNVKAGPIEAGVSEKKTIADDPHAKIEAIVSYLRKRGQMGTVDSDHEWFQGEVYAGSIMDGGEMFFGGRIDQGEKPIDLVLLGSRRHMIGSEYHVDRNDYYSETEKVGPTRSWQYNINSNNWQFGHALNGLFRVEDLAVAADFSMPKHESIILERYRLSPAEQANLRTREQWNAWIQHILEGEAWPWHLINIDLGPPLPKMRPSLAQKLLNIFRKPVIRIMLGSKLYHEKKHAVGKAYIFEHLNEETLDQEERKILRDAYSFLVNVGGDRLQYEYVARRLLEGFRVEPARDLVYASRPPEDGNYISRTVIASPLYMAIKSRY